MSNILFQNVLNKVPQDVPPIWCMRQAGRYQKSYRALRERYSFKEICQTPELAARVTISAIKEFDFDTAIFFSDILFPLEAIGMQLNYLDSGAPFFTSALTDEMLSTSEDEVIDRLKFQYLGIKAAREELDPSKSLIGFIGAPFTLFAYAVEKQPLTDIQSIFKKMDLYKKFCNVMIPFLRLSMQRQLDAGCELIVVFDSAAGRLTSEQYKDLVLPTLKPLLEGYKTIYFPNGNYNFSFSDYAVPGLALNTTQDIVKYFPSDLIIQGNFNEKFLLLPSDELEIKLQEYFRPIVSFPKEKRANWICSLGHGILPQTPEANLHRFVSFVRNVFAKH